MNSSREQAKKSDNSMPDDRDSASPVQRFRIDIAEIAALIKISDEVGSDISEGRRLLLIAINMGKTNKNFEIIAKYLSESRTLMENAIEDVVVKKLKAIQQVIETRMDLLPPELEITKRFQVIMDAFKVKNYQPVTQGMHSIIKDIEIFVAIKIGPDGIRELPPPPPATPPPSAPAPPVTQPILPPSPPSPSPQQPVQQPPNLIAAQDAISASPQSTQSRPPIKENIFSGGISEQPQAPSPEVLAWIAEKQKKKHMIDEQPEKSTETIPHQQPVKIEENAQMATPPPTIETKPSVTIPAETTTQEPKQTQETTAPQSQESSNTSSPQPAPQYIISKAESMAKCAFCKGAIKPGFTMITCNCGETYHETCGKRKGICVKCGTKFT